MPLALELGLAGVHAASSEEYEHRYERNGVTDTDPNRHLPLWGRLNTNGDSTPAATPVEVAKLSEAATSLMCYTSSRWS